MKEVLLEILKILLTVIVSLFVGLHLAICMLYNFLVYGNGHTKCPPKEDIYAALSKYQDLVIERI